jgi:DNA-directed RNA polymerase specialized sigma24 family protein
LANQHTDGWSDEDVQVLLEGVGVLTFDGIARKLGKTPEAVESKLDKLGAANTKIASGLITMHELAIFLCVDDKVVKRLITNHGLPHYRKNFRRYEYAKKMVDGKRISKRLFYYINVEEFWKWAEENKDLINWHQVPEDALPPEPLWVNARRKEDFYKWLKRPRPWTPEQDNLLKQYYYTQGMTQKQCGTMLGRSESSVEKRLARLRKMEKEALKNAKLN